jgi:hypothetical protein
VFDSVASADDLEAALLLESLTDDRVNETLTRLTQLDRSEWLTGQPGATLVMAAFCHPAPGGVLPKFAEGGRTKPPISAASSRANSIAVGSSPSGPII